MATIVLNWTAGGGANVTGQLVQRRTSSGSFATIATVSGATNTYTDSTAADNTIYFYRIVTECSVGGPSNSASEQVVKLVCPEDITITQNGSDVTVDLPPLSGDAIYTTLTIKQGATTVFTDTINANGPYTNTIGLSYNTSYDYIIVIAADEETLECSGSFTIDPAPVCPPVTGLSAEVS